MAQGNWRRAVVLGGLVWTVAGLAGWSATAEGDRVPPASRAKIFVHPERLTAADRLVDGPSGPAIEIRSETVLVWIDRMPDARYAHPTEYVLISAEGTRVVKGDWWPVVNDRPLFREGKPPRPEFPLTVTIP